MDQYLNSYDAEPSPIYSEVEFDRSVRESEALVVCWLLTDNHPGLTVLTRIKPGYLQDLVTRRAVGRTRRSSSVPQLTVPRTVAKSKILVDLCFSVAAPSMYNHLPGGMRKDLSFPSFKRKLKTPTVH